MLSLDDITKRLGYYPVRLVGDGDKCPSLCSVCTGPNRPFKTSESSNITMASSLVLSNAPVLILLFSLVNYCLTGCKQVRHSFLTPVKVQIVTCSAVSKKSLHSSRVLLQLHGNIVPLLACRLAENRLASSSPQ